MASTITPNYTDNITVLALQTILLQGVARAVLDWRTKRGGWIFGCIGRGNTTALNNTIYLIVRRMINGTTIVHPGPVAMLAGSSQAAVRPTCAGTGNAAGQNLLDVSSTTGFYNSTTSRDGSFIYIDGNGGTGNSEWAQVSAIVSSTRLALAEPLQYAHANTSDHASSYADVFVPVWVDGGAEIEVMIDYGISTTGNTQYIRVMAQTYDNDTAS